ncbi:MAG: class I SAM-dependent methyltransferase [Candidatus Dadabacteria bacterium]|nr:class I SAM-dependent methyltransferase [Candidatus Dadabacteria bacterium]
MDFFDPLRIYEAPDIIKSLMLFRRIKNELYALLERADMPYPLRERVLHANSGSLKVTDAHILRRLLAEYRPETVLEVGSFLGFSTRWLLECSKGWGAAVTAVDPNIRHRIFDDPLGFVESLNSGFVPNSLEIVRGFFGPYDDCVYYHYEHHEPKQSRDFVDRLLDGVQVIDKDWHGKYDFIFIDGNHRYETVMSHFEIAARLLNVGGCIVFHDALSWEGVSRALEELGAEYSGMAEVKIYGGLDRVVLNKLFGKLNDGIGVFRLLYDASAVV